MKTIPATALLATLFLLAWGCGSDKGSNSLVGTWEATTLSAGQNAAATAATQQPLTMTFDITNSPNVSTVNDPYAFRGSPTQSSGTTANGANGTATATTANGGGSNTITVSNLNVESGMSCFSGSAPALAAIGTPAEMTPTTPVLNANGGFVNGVNATGSGGTGTSGGTTGTGGTNGTGGTTGGTTGNTTGGTTGTTGTGTVNVGAAGLPITIEAWSGANQTGNHLVITANLNRDLNSGTGTYSLFAGTGTTTGTTGTTSDTTTATPGTTTTSGTCQDSSGAISLVRQSSGTNTATATPTPGATPTATPTATATPAPTPTSTPGH